MCELKTSEMTKTFKLPAELKEKPFHKKEQACNKCKVVFPYTLEHFALNTSTNTNGKVIYLRPDCRDCNKKMNQGKNKAKNLAGNPKPPLLGSCCDRCGCDPGPNKKDPTKANLVFDHCHETLIHRGWLCDNCNRSMGMLGDNVKGMLISAIYIAKTTNIPFNVVSDQLSKLWN
jgi:hypothetical protein